MIEGVFYLQSRRAGNGQELIVSRGKSEAASVHFPGGQHCRRQLDRWKMSDITCSLKFLNRSRIAC